MLHDHTRSAVFEQSQAVVQRTIDAVTVDQTLVRPLVQGLQQLAISVKRHGVGNLAVHQLEIIPGYAKSAGQEVGIVKTGLVEDIAQRQRNLNAVCLEGAQHIGVLFNGHRGFETVCIQQILPYHRTIVHAVVDVGSKEHAAELHDRAAVAVDALFDVSGAFIVFINHLQEVGSILLDQVVDIQQNVVFHRAFNAARILLLEHVGVEQIRPYAGGDGGIEESAVIIDRRMHEFQRQTSFLFNLLHNGMLAQVRVSRLLRCVELAIDGQRFAGRRERKFGLLGLRGGFFSEGHGAQAHQHCHQQANHSGPVFHFGCLLIYFASRMQRFRAFMHSDSN